MIYLFLLFVSCLGFKPAGSFCMILFCIISYSLDHFALYTFFLSILALILCVTGILETL